MLGDDSKAPSEILALKLRDSARNTAISCEGGGNERQGSLSEAIRRSLPPPSQEIAVFLALKGAAMNDKDLFRKLSVALTGVGDVDVKIAEENEARISEAFPKESTELMDAFAKIAGSADLNAAVVKL